MPIYEYECQSCKSVTEAIQKISDAPLKKCPECGGKVSKLMSMNTFHLKGSGWYVTDYARKNGPGATSAPKAEKAEKTEKAEKKTETKKESKADSTK